MKKSTVSTRVRGRDQTRNKIEAPSYPMVLVASKYTRGKVMSMCLYPRVQCDSAVLAGGGGRRNPRAPDVHIVGGILW